MLVFQIVCPISTLMMEQCLGCGLTPLLSPIGATHIHPHSLPCFSPPHSLPGLAGTWAHIRGKGRSIWPEDGLAVVRDKGEGRGPVLKRMKETLSRVTYEIGCQVRARLTLITSSGFSSKVMLTVVTCLPGNLPSVCMNRSVDGTVAVT